MEKERISTALLQWKMYLVDGKRQQLVFVTFEIDDYLLILWGKNSLKGFY